MSDILDSWLDKEASRSTNSDAFIDGAKLLQSRVSGWIMAISSSESLSPYARSALFELMDEMSVWCGDAERQG